MEEITVSDDQSHGFYITYLYNALAQDVLRAGGHTSLRFGERAELVLSLPKRSDSVRARLTQVIAEVIGIGYKNAFLEKTLTAALSAREKKLLRAALIAADYDGDIGYIIRKITPSNAYAVDGTYNFRLARLREKWEKIVSYVPAGFSSVDLTRFCEFLVGESRNKIYLRDNKVFGENFTPLARSKLTGEEDLETEILLSDAGFVYCLGNVSDEIGDFLQKYYAERAIFS